jgi:predicted hotdog family 3-hydroxylacyl-ACP dehydratase
MNTDIEALIPHRGPMRLINRLIEADDESVRVEVDIPHQGHFVRNGAMPGFVGIELMAQAVAAWAGARANRAGRAPRVGFLLGSRCYECRVAAFPAGATLEVQACCELMADNGLGMFDCTITRDGRTLATARISVFEPSSTEASDEQ